MRAFTNCHAIRPCRSLSVKRTPNSGEWRMEKRQIETKIQLENVGERMRLEKCGWKRRIENFKWQCADA